MVTPSLNDKRYSNVVRERKKLQEEPTSAKVTLLSDASVGVTSGATFSRVNKSGFMQAQKKSTKASSDGKNTRIERNDLLDLLFTLFEEFDYWSLKGLKDRTKQPEVYLKEVLESMAVLNKKGPYAMRYSLKPEYKHIKQKKSEDQKGSSSLSEYMSQSASGSSAAGGSLGADLSGGAGDNDDDDDDDDVEMETVI